MSNRNPPPETLESKVVVKFGVPLTDVRRQSDTPVLITINTTQSYRFIASLVREEVRRTHPQLQIPEVVDVYLKKTVSARQQGYLRLSEGNFYSSIAAVAAGFARRRQSQPLVELFVYLEAPEQSAPAARGNVIRRATAARVQASATALQEHFASMPAEERPGPLSMQYLAEHNARLGDDEPIELPDNPLLRQLNALDRMGSEPAQNEEYVRIRVKLSGICIPFELNVHDLRAAVTQGDEERRRSFLQENHASVSVNQRDVDHED